MKTDERFFDFKVFEQHPRVPCVLRRDRVSQFQYLQRAQGDVAKISNWRRDDVKHARSSDEIWFCAIGCDPQLRRQGAALDRSEEHTSELQSPCNLVCR